ncbi:EexN family lipoprotein [Herbaspirillum sp. RV1423]|uniref:EexN family lipoprotein n=1 Tax=Herbaspirillum sp. RV1423 TaxID=1443993 RepID=UPI0004B86A67|nr:EexN family lipoprotein [Herbaspirillum sp. RV1423]
MKISLKHSLALLCIAAPLLAGCDAMAGKKDYAYFRQHLDEAKSVADQCQLNGTSGMSKAQIAQCDAARDAYSNRNYAY